MTRIVIEAKTQKAEKAIEKLATESVIEIVDRFNPITRLSAEVEKLGRALRDYKKSEGSYEVMMYYLRGRGVSQGSIDEVMKGVKQFFAAAGIDIDEQA